jgi:ferredoxin-NADP reductase
MQWASIHAPKKAGVVEVEILERGMPHADAKSYLYLDGVTGQVLKLSHYATGASLGRKVYLYFIALHSGLIGGIGYQLLLMLACFSVPVQAYSGFSPYIRKQLRKGANGALPLRVVAKTVEAEAITSFELAHPKGKVLPAFSAGSHIDLQIAPGLVRQYSLCNDPKETHRYLVAVLREEESRGGSVRMHEAVEVGDTLQAGPPRNHFPLAHGAERTLLIAGGIGITPILCMAERLANIEADFRLHYCVRSYGQAAFVERIRTSDFAQRVRFHVSEEGGRLNVASLLRQQAPETHVYVCGPNRLIDEVVETARALGWAEARIHREYFAAAQHDTADDKPFDLKVASTGLVIQVPKACSVVQALATHGIDIPTSCSEGVCGTCLTRVLEGVVQHRDMLLSPEERARNDQFTPCCSRSAGPLLVLDL